MPSTRHSPRATPLGDHFAALWDPQHLVRWQAPNPTHDIYKEVKHGLVHSQSRGGAHDDVSHESGLACVGCSKLCKRMLQPDQSHHKEVDVKLAMTAKKRVWSSTAEPWCWCVVCKMRPRMVRNPLLANLLTSNAHHHKATACGQSAVASGRSNLER